jgi:Kef-type K+ transport system membrane component KefB
MVMTRSEWGILALGICLFWAVIALAQEKKGAAETPKGGTPQEQKAGPAAPPFIPFLEPPPAFTPEELGQSIFPAQPRTARRGESAEDALLGRQGAPTITPSAATIVKAVLGFVALLVLAYLFGTPQVLELEKRLQIAHLVIAGLPFVFLGVIARHPAIGIFPDSVIYELRPIIPLGLGFIGFTIGFRFDREFIESVKPGMGNVAFLSALMPFVTVLASTFFVLVVLTDFIPDRIYLRDAIMLGAACAMTARSAPYLLEARGASKESMEKILRIVHLEQLAGILGLMIVTAYFRPSGADVAWQLPGTAWLFITIGIGATMAGIIYALLMRTSPGPQFAVVTLGSVCFAAGMASFLRLSAVAVCFIAGMILVNFPGTWKRQVRFALERMERPIYLLLLTSAGLVWNIAEWQGWALMVIFVCARFAGKWLAVWLVRKRDVIALNPDEEKSLMIGPIGSLSIAIIMSATDLYVGRDIPWLFTAIIGGAIVTEIILQRSSRGYDRREDLPRTRSVEVG